MAVKKITLKIDEETYRKARIRAAERGTSVSAMVRDFLILETQKEDHETQRIAALEDWFKEVERQGTPRSRTLKPLTRDEIYAERLR